LLMRNDLYFFLGDLLPRNRMISRIFTKSTHNSTIRSTRKYCHSILIYVMKSLYMWRSLALAFCLMGYSSQNALTSSIIYASSNVDVITPPESVFPGLFENDSHASIFQEANSVTLVDEVAVDISVPGVYADSSSLSPTNIMIGALVDSYFVHFDPLLSGPKRINVMLTFSSEILGIVVSPPGFQQTSIFKAPATRYPAFGGLPLELSTTDSEVSDRIRWEGNTITLDLRTTSSIDNVRIICKSLDQVSVFSLPDSQHNPLDERQSIKDLRVTPSGKFAFTFSGANVGPICIVSSSSDLMRWQPLIQFQTESHGTDVVNEIKDRSQFYRATFLPKDEVQTAYSFDYPIGSGSGLEQITPERNNLYPDGTQGSVERPQLSQVFDSAQWFNAQDVGSYLVTTKGPAYHPGEDWNLGGSGMSVIDIGQPVQAVANGIVMDISPLNVSSNGGWAIVVRHYLLNGDSIDSIYVHVAPSFKADHVAPNSLGEIGSESWFAFQEGSPVAKGDIIAVVADVDAYPDHLHFEMRNKPIEGLPLGAGSAAISKYWPNSLGNAYYQSFSAMSKDKIIDPSDFIDDHR